MPRRVRTPKLKLMALSSEQFFELTCGPDPRGSTFESVFVRMAAWAGHRDELMAAVSECARPWAYYAYQLKGHPPRGDSTESSYMRAARFLEGRGLLSEHEVAVLAAMRVLALKPDDDPNESLMDERRTK